MPAALFINEPSDDAGLDPASELMDLSDHVARTIAMTQALVASRRHVDLQGLQEMVGLLCAKTLDLQPTQTGFLKLELQKLVSALDGLTASLRANAA